MKNDDKNTGFIFLKKAEIIKEVLKDNIGIFSILQDGMVTISKCGRVFELSGSLPQSSSFRILGITHSENVYQEIRRFVNSIETNTSRVFSPRDVNFKMITYELAESIEENFYDSELEKPLPVELLCLAFLAGSISVRVIRYDGEIVVPSIDQDHFLIFGCTDEEKIKELSDFIGSEDLTQMTVKKFMHYIVPKLEQFSGTFSYEVAMFE